MSHSYRHSCKPWWIDSFSDIQTRSKPIAKPFYTYFQSLAQIFSYLQKCSRFCKNDCMFLLHQARGMSGGSKNIKQAFLFFWKNYFISISVNVGIFNSVLYIDTCNFVMGWNRETSFVTRPDPCQGVKTNVWAAAAHTHGSRYSDSPMAVQLLALCPANCQWKIGDI